MMEQWKERLEAVRKQAMPLVLKYRAVLIVLLAGVLLLASAGHGSDEPANSAPPAVQETADVELTSFEQ